MARRSETHQRFRAAAGCGGLRVIASGDATLFSPAIAQPEPGKLLSFNGGGSRVISSIQSGRGCRGGVIPHGRQPGHGRTLLPNGGGTSSAALATEGERTTLRHGICPHRIGIPSATPTRRHHRPQSRAKRWGGGAAPFPFVVVRPPLGVAAGRRSSRRAELLSSGGWFYWGLSTERFAWMRFFESSI